MSVKPTDLGSLFAHDKFPNELDSSQKSQEWRTSVIFSPGVPRGSNSLEYALTRDVHYGYHVDTTNRECDRKADYIIEILSPSQTIFFDNVLGGRFAIIHYLDSVKGQPILEVAPDIRSSRKSHLSAFLDYTRDANPGSSPRRRFDMRTNFGVQTWSETEVREPNDWTSGSKFFVCRHSPHTAAVPWYLSGSKPWPFSFEATIIFFINRSFEISVKLHYKYPLEQVPVMTLMHACMIAAWAMKPAIYDPTFKPLRFCF